MAKKNQRLDQEAIRHGNLKKSSALKNTLRFLLTTALVFALSGISVAAYAAWDLWNKVETVTLNETEVKPKETLGVKNEPIEGAFAIALIGSDTREGQTGYRDDVEGELNDVNILLYVDESHKNATIISFSRDMMVPVPACPSPDGMYMTYYESEAQINTALFKGGLPCAVQTLEEFVGIDIPYAGLITFDGVINMSNAIGGVEVCLAQPIYDEHTDLDLPAGDVTLVGREALQFLRTRHGVGDGGDGSRVANQQVFMSAMVRQLMSSKTLSDPMKVYRLAKAAVENITLSDTLVDIPVMQSMALVLKDLDLERINFVQFPVVGHPYDPNRYAPNWVAAQGLLDVIRSGQAFEVTSLGVSAIERGAGEEGLEETPIENLEGEGEGETQVDPNAPVQIDPSITGQSAAQETCSQGRTAW